MSELMYCPALARAVGSVNAGILAAYLRREALCSPDGWVRTSSAEVERATALSAWQQRTARRNLEKAGLLQSKIGRGRSGMFLMLDVRALAELRRSVDALRA